MAYEVQHYTLCDGWVNCWVITAPDGTETPQTFDTMAEAQAEIDEHIADQGDMYDDEGMEFDEDSERDQYRIEEI